MSNNILFNGKKLQKLEIEFKEDLAPYTFCLYENGEDNALVKNLAWVNHAFGVRIGTSDYQNMSKYLQKHGGWGISGEFNGKELEIKVVVGGNLRNQKFKNFKSAFNKLKELSKENTITM